MKTSENISNISKALVGAVRQIEDAKRTEAAHQYNYADLAGVLAAARPALIANELAVLQPPSTTVEGRICVTTRILHSSGEWMESDISLSPETLNRSNVAQATGSVITYLRRYSLAGVMGIAQIDDDAAMAEQPKKTPSKKSAAKKQIAAVAKTPETAEYEITAIIQAGLDQKIVHPATLKNWKGDGVSQEDAEKRINSAMAQAVSREVNDGA
jgi:hypothetical protein